MNMYTLRLKTENKIISKQLYKEDHVKDIQFSVQKAAHNFGIKDYVFETVVKTDSNQLIYCAFRMSELIFKFFCNAYGSRRILEKDYQVTEHK